MWWETVQFPLYFHSLSAESKMDVLFLAALAVPLILGKSTHEPEPASPFLIKGLREELEVEGKWACQRRVGRVGGGGVMVLSPGSGA